jgi:hypothetical protein
MLASKILNKKILIISFLIAVCLSISYYIQSIGYEQVYTHLFYIPIILSCIWWQRKGIIIASFLGILIVILGFLLRPDATVLYNILRASVFVIIAELVSRISISEKNARNLLRHESEKANVCSTDVSGKNLELEIKQKELISKNEELEKINRLMLDRELKMIEMKKRIEELEKIPK